MSRMPARVCGLVSLIVLGAIAAGCEPRACCGPPVVPGYGRVYGVVRSASQEAAAGVFVQGEGSSGVTTDSLGQYSLGMMVYGRQVDTLRHVPVRAVRRNTSGVVIDSAQVSALVHFYDKLPELDSTQVDITLPTTP